MATRRNPIDPDTRQERLLADIEPATLWLTNDDIGYPEDELGDTYSLDPSLIVEHAEEAIGVNCMGLTIR